MKNHSLYELWFSRLNILQLTLAYSVFMATGYCFVMLHAERWPCTNCAKCRAVTYRHKYSFQLTSYSTKTAPDESRASHISPLSKVQGLVFSNRHNKINETAHSQKRSQYFILKCYRVLNQVSVLINENRGSYQILFLIFLCPGKV